MRSLLLLILCLLCCHAFAQVPYAEGIVFDRDSKERIAIVSIQNLRNGNVMYNSLNGVFKIDANPGDQLVFSKMDYYSDTVTVTGAIANAIYLKRTAIQLREVTIFDSLLSPKSIMAKNRKQYSRAYGSLANRDLLSMSSGSVGVSIDALYNIFSRAGKDARMLRNAIDEEYKADLIDQRFNRTLVARVTGLKSFQLDDFMKKYRPGYYFITYASEYELITSIRANLKRFKRNPTANSLPPLIIAE